MEQARECNDQGCYWKRPYRESPLIPFGPQRDQKHPANELTLPGKKIYNLDTVADRFKVRVFLLIHPGEIGARAIKNLLQKRRGN